MPQRSDEVRYRKAGESDVSFDCFTAECLKKLADDNPQQFRWDEEAQILYMKIGILREAAGEGRFPADISVSHSIKPTPPSHSISTKELRKRIDSGKRARQ